MEDENIYAAPKAAAGIANQRSRRGLSRYKFLLITFLPSISIPIVAYFLSKIGYDYHGVGWDASVLIPFCIAIACGIWTGCKYARERKLSLNAYIGHSLVWEILHIGMLFAAFSFYYVISGFWR